MNLQVDVERVFLAQKTVRAELVAERTPRGHWVGRVANSPLATAAAVSALVVSHQRTTEDLLCEHATGGHVGEHIVQGDLCEFLLDSVDWLARQQNPDGGWGDCDGAPSNLAATLLVQAAFRLTGIPARYADLMDQADDYVAKHGGISALRRDFAHDWAFVAAVLANCALAGMVSWRQVPTLQFELCCLPHRWQKHVQMPVPRHTTPTFLAAGLAKFHHRPPRNPLMRVLRRSLRAKAVAQLERFQTGDDSFLASVLTTAFVVMSLGSSGRQDHPVVRRGIEFLLSHVRGDASWPVVNSLSTRVTSLAISSLTLGQQPWPSSVHERETTNSHAPPAGDAHWADTATANDTVTDDSAGRSSYANPTNADEHAEDAPTFAAPSIDWLLECQRTLPHPLIDLPPGGWGASEAAGALPNAGDTAQALIALARVADRELDRHREQMERAAARGIEWLLRLQNDDGGWSTFCRDPLNQEFNESAADATALALRAFHAWRRLRSLAPQLRDAIDRGWKYLAESARPDGSFVPKWFGNHHHRDHQNPVIGTAEVLLMCAELDRLQTELAQNAIGWLLSAQHATGGWGPPRAPVNYSSAESDGFRACRRNEALAKFCTVEETALAITALLPLAESNDACSKAVSQGLTWLATAVELDAHRRPAVLGFYPGKIWYHERLYPLVFSVEALTLATCRLASQQPAATTVG